MDKGEQHHEHGRQQHENYKQKPVLLERQRNGRERTQSLAIREKQAAENSVADKAATNNKREKASKKN